jgi:hypothetical protein
MKALQRVLVAAALVLIGFLALRTAREFTRAQTTKQKLAALHSELRGARERLEELAARVEADARASQPGDSTRPRAGAPAQSTPPAPPRPAGMRPWLSRVFAEHPHVHALYLEAYRADLWLRYGLAMRQLGLSESEATRLVDILAQDMERASDIVATVRAKDMSAVDPSIKAMTTQRERDRDAALLELLGEERSKRWKSADHALASQMVGKLALTFQRGPEPLTGQQATELARVFSLPGAVGLYVPAGVVVPPEYRQQIVGVWAETEKVLTARQFAQFRASLTAQQALSQLQNSASGRAR